VRSERGKTGEQKGKDDGRKSEKLGKPGSWPPLGQLSQ